MAEHPDELELARRARDGDREALSDLIERLRAGLYRLAYGVLGRYDDAQDAVANALVHICRHAEDVREPDRMRAWMKAIVLNEARKITGPGTGPWAEIEEIPVEDEDSALRMDIGRALLRLPRDQAHALALRYLAGLPVGEIARRTDRPEGTIKRWLHFGRRHLAKEMEEYAPMTRTAAIIGTDLGAIQATVVDGLRSAGFDEVLTLDALPAMEKTGSGDDIEFHLPDPLRSARMVVLDEWIGGRSAFEVYSILKASSEGRDLITCILLSQPTESTLFAAWSAGFDICLARESLDAAEFSRLTHRALKARPSDSPSRNQ